MTGTKGITLPVFLIDMDIGILLGKDGKESEKAIDSLLKLFEVYNIPATWAIVGCLFIEYPSTMKRILEKIVGSGVKHEIGYHSFLHINFSERSRRYAEAEIKEGLKLAKQLGVAFRSFVFPNNAIGHIDVLRENGFIIYRGQNIMRGSTNQSLLIRVLNKVINQLISQPVEPKWREGIWEVPCSMPFSNPVIFPSFTLLPRAKIGIKKAIRLKEVFDTYSHPSDLAIDPSLIKKLDTLLAFVAKKRDEGKLQTLTMGELGSILTKTYVKYQREEML